MAQITNDTELWQACCDGQRDAFRRVVERYQGLVTSITYNATGDIPTSEDLAQDTFLQAWRKISTLKEPEKLAGWLCAIARNRVRDWIRRTRKDIGRKTVRLADEMVYADTQPEPDKELEQEDETAMVWRLIEKIPDNNREVLILHYREQMDARQIAEALEVSEDVVRQRLSRARGRVRRELASAVERGLQSARPSQAFTLAVMAALPALTPKVATAAVGGGVAAKSTGALASLSIFIGPIIGLFSGAAGTWMAFQNVESEKERRFMVRFMGLIWLTITVFLCLFLSQAWLRGSLSGGKVVLVNLLLTVVYIGVLIPIVVIGHRRLNAIRREQGSPDACATRTWGLASRVGIYGVLGGSIFASLLWMIVLAAEAGDLLGAVIVAVIGLATFFTGASVLKRRGNHATRPVLYGVTVVIGATTLAVVNLRFHDWLAHNTGKPLAEVHANLPLWSVNLLAITIFFMALVLIWLGMFISRPHDPIQPGSAREDARGSRR